MKLELGFRRLCRDGLSPSGLNRRENKNSIFIQEQEGGNEKKRSSLALTHLVCSVLALELGFVPAPIPAGRAETMLPLLPQVSLCLFSLRRVQKGYFKIKPHLPCSEGTQGKRSSGSCSRLFPKTFCCSASETCSFPRCPHQQR